MRNAAESFRKVVDKPWRDIVALNAMRELMTPERRGRLMYRVIGDALKASVKSICIEISHEFENRGLADYTVDCTVGRNEIFFYLIAEFGDALVIEANPEDADFEYFLFAGLEDACALGDDEFAESMTLEPEQIAAPLSPSATKGKQIRGVRWISFSDPRDLMLYHRWLDWRKDNKRIVSDYLRNDFEFMRRTRSEFPDISAEGAMLLLGKHLGKNVEGWNLKEFALS